MKPGALKIIAIVIIGYLSFLTCKKSEDTTQFKVTDVSVVDNTVKVKGEITSLSGNKNSEYGICYASKNNPTTADSVLSLGTPKVGTFSAEIKNLSRNHKYYVRAYIKDGGNNLYDDIKLASISGIAPTTLTQAASAVSETSATINGTVNPNGSASTVSFEYGLTSGYGSTIAAVPNSLNGSSGTTVSAGLASLTPNTTYHFRVKAVNALGTSTGDDMTFTTSTIATVPVVTTASISAVTSTTATSGGNVTSDGGAAVIARGVCWSTAANPVVTDSKSSDASGTGSYVSTITGLAQGTLYHVRAYATNSAGTAYGSDLSFTTISVPTVTTTAISALTSTSATSGGNISSDGGSAVTARGVCWSTTANPTVSDSKTSDATGTGLFVSNITGLSQGTVYHVRAYATNSAGTAYGSDIQFTTTCPPPVTVTNAASGIGTNSATLNGNINTNGYAANVTFEYGATTTYGSSAASTPGSVSGSSATAVSSAITGLMPNTLYHFRVITTGCGGTVNGNDITFTTLCAPASVTTNTAASVSSSSATLPGTVNANFSSVTVTVEYGTTTAYGNSSATTPATVTGNSNTAVSAGIAGLTPNTLYHFRIKGVGCGGTVYGNDLTFTTLCSAPVATTNSAVVSGISSATLFATVNANWSTTSVTFEYGTTTGYGTSVTASPGTASGNSNTAVNAAISGLAQGTLYHFRIKAVNCGGTVYGNDMMFGTKVRDIDNNDYNVVVINSQLWTKENLRVTHYNDGSALVQYSDTSSIGGTSYYHYYNNNAAYAATYGIIYNGYVVDGAQNICPTGWHVPASTEWTDLENYLGGSGVAGGKMKEAGTSHWTSPNTGADNSSGFTALPGGQYTTNYNGMNILGSWWSNGGSYSYRYIQYNSSGIFSGTGNIESGFYVRCKK